MSAKRARKSKNFHNNVVQLTNYLPEKKKIVKERRCIQVNYVTFKTDWKVN